MRHRIPHIDEFYPGDAAKDLVRTIQNTVISYAPLLFFDGRLGRIGGGPALHVVESVRGASAVAHTGDEQREPGLGFVMVGEFAPRFLNGHVSVGLRFRVVYVGSTQVGPFEWERRGQPAVFRASDLSGVYFSIGVGMGIHI